MGINLSLHHLRAIDSLQRTRSFTAAADQISVSQPALSRTIAEAERRVGVRLFDRTTRNVLTTAAGDQVALYAAHAVASFDTALSRISGFVTGEAGEVRIACLPSVAATLLPPVVASFRAEYPGVDLVIHDAPQNRLLPLIADGSADIGLVTVDEALPDSLSATSCAEDPFVAIVPTGHRLSARASLTWNELDGEDLIVFNKITSIGPLVERAITRHDVNVTIVQRADSIPAVGGMVTAGIGITIAPRLILPLMNFTSISAIPLIPEVHRTLALVHLADAPLPRPVANFKQRFMKAHAHGPSTP